MATGRHTTGYETSTIREQHINLALGDFEIDADIDSVVIRVHFTRDNGRMVSKSLRFNPMDIEEVRRSKTGW